MTSVLFTLAVIYIQVVLTIVILGAVLGLISTLDDLDDDNHD